MPGQSASVCYARFLASRTRSVPVRSETVRSWMNSGDFSRRFNTSGAVTVGDFQGQPAALAQVVRRLANNQTVEGEPVRPAVECERGVEAPDFGLKGPQVAGGDIGGI